MTVTWETESPFIIRAAHGMVAPLAELQTMHKVPSATIGGGVAIVEYTLAPGRLAAPLHRHSREDEISYVLAGQMGALLGGKVIQARAGSYVIKPRGQWHTFWNAAGTDLRLVEMIVPGGLDVLLDRLSAVIGEGRSPARREIEALGAEFGVEFDFDTIDELCRQFGLAAGCWQGSGIRD